MYNSTFDLRGKRIDNTYPQVVQYDSASNIPYNGVGNSLAFTSSYSLTSSFALNGGGSNSSSYSLTSSYSAQSDTSTITNGTQLFLPTYPGMMNILAHLQGTTTIFSSPASVDDIGNIYANFIGTSSLASTSSITLMYPDLYDDKVNHRIGVGTPTPRYTLEVNGNVGGTDNNWLIDTFGATYFGANHGMVGIGISIPAYTLDVNGPIANSTTNDYLIGSSKTSSYFNANGGNVGIGNNTPMYELDVSGSIGYSGFGNANFITLDTGNGNMLINFARKLGILQSQPSFSLDVNGIIGNIGGNLQLQSGFQTFGGGSTQGYNVLIIPGTGSISNGVVGINHYHPTYSLDVKGDINFSGNLYSSSVIYVPTNAITASYVPGAGSVPSLPDITDNIPSHKVGIVQTNPIYTLDVSNDCRIGTSEFGNLNFITLDNGSGGMVLNGTYLIVSMSIMGGQITCSAINISGSILNSGSYYHIDGQGNSSYLNANGGNVGIGTNNPQYTLDINGNVNFSGNRFLQNGEPFTASSAATASLLYGTTIQSPSNLNIVPNGVVLIGPGTVVGINTTNPVATLDVNGSIANGTTGDFMLNTGGNVSWINGNGGNVGIGTSSPTYSLDVNGTVGDSDGSNPNSYIDLNNDFVFDNNSQVVIDWNNKLLQYLGQSVIDWKNGIIYDNDIVFGPQQSVLTNDRILMSYANFTPAQSLDWQNHILYGGVWTGSITTSSYALTSSYSMNGGSGNNISSSWASSSVSSSYSLISTYTSQFPDITDNTTNHRVGINKNNPQSSLDVNGNIQLSGYLINNTSSTFPLNSNVVGILAGAGSTSNNLNYFGFGAGNASTNAHDSNIFGFNAGNSAATIYNCNFLGFNAGYQSSIVNDSNFFGYQSGYLSVNSYGSNFFGNSSGFQVSASYYSNFIGYQAGSNNSNSFNSNFIGFLAGDSSNGNSNCNFIGTDAGSFSNLSSNSNFIGYQTGTGAASSSYANFMGYQAGNLAVNVPYSNFIGYQSGYGASTSSNSNFIGNNAGYQATNSPNCLFVGDGAGYQSTNCAYSIFIGDATSAKSSQYTVCVGYSAGAGASNLTSSNCIGYFAGYESTNTNYANMIGYQAGYLAPSSSNSTFIGYMAGANTQWANNSIFIGYLAGNNNNTLNNSGSHSSILIGDYTSTLGYSDSIAIGKGTANNTNNQFNIGNVLYGLNIHSSSSPTSLPQTNGKVGVLTNSPQYPLDVNGTINSTGFILPPSSSAVIKATGSMFYSSSRLWVFTGTSNNYGAGAGWATASLSI